jgi:hypothetical protein
MSQSIGHKHNVGASRDRRRRSKVEGLVDAMLNEMLDPAMASQG